MSDNIPFEIQEDIIKRLPPRSLIQFRSVSKSWKSLIDSSLFIAHYSGQHHLLVRYKDSVYSDPKYVSIVDDDNSFPHHKDSVTLPPLVRMLQCPTIIGSSNGLLCLEGLYHPSEDGAIPGTSVAVLWNISIQKAVAVVLPNIVLNDMPGSVLPYRTVLGFGVCPETSDPKIVKVTHSVDHRDTVSSAGIPPPVEVFTLSTGAWRSPLSILPRKSLQFYDQVVIDGLLYWLATERITRFLHKNMIISFDITSEEFREVNLPDCLERQFIDRLSIYKLKESLVVLKSNEVYVNDEGAMVTVVWMMEDGFQRSFIKLFTLDAPDSTVRRVRGFRKTGELVGEVVEHRPLPVGYCSAVVDEFPCDVVKDYSLVVYEPYSKHIHNLGIDGSESSFTVYPYMETLLLHDHPSFTVYYNGRRCISEWF